MKESIFKNKEELELLNCLEYNQSRMNKHKGMDNQTSKGIKRKRKEYLVI
jgi:hypothetical protein